MQKKVTAIFDIGKTNKKFFLFDENFQEVYREYISFEETTDEDGYPTEDLQVLTQWLKEVFNRILEATEFDITAINFSTYGASFVHLDEEGNPLTPLYNYTKPYPKDLTEEFYQQYGPEEEFSVKTGSTNSGMLNSGMQLYWLKKTQPEVFSRINYSLHLPQYLSYVFTGIPISEYTSIGCHTALWDYEKKDYHKWVYAENIHKILPPIVSTETSINMNYNGKRIKIGVGIHDSSAALIPYVRSQQERFILVSTGTWSIALNPFSQHPLERTGNHKDVITYMKINGNPVKSTRIFLGNEYKLQVKLLAKYFGVPTDYHKSVSFDYNLYTRLKLDFTHHFAWKSIESENAPVTTFLPSTSFEIAYHQLMMELVLLQIQSIKDAVGTDEIKKIFIDGGFSDNDIFVKLISHYLRNMELRTTNASLGSALGAAICISDATLDSEFLKKNYSLKKHVPPIVK